MAARAIWKGTLQVGSDSVPVKLYSAVENRTVHFHLLEARTQTRVKQHMVNPETEQEVPKEEIRKGYEVEPGRFLLLDDEELKALEPTESRDIQVSHFLPPEQIVHQWYERPYYLGPDGEDRKYFALAEALGRQNREGLAHWVMRKKHYHGALRPKDGYLVLVTLRPAEEVLSARAISVPSGRELDPREIQMAEQLVAVLQDDFRPEDFRDEYRERVMKLIQTKAEGRKTKLAAVPQKRPPKSLLDVLSASLQTAKRVGGKAVA